MQFATQDEGRGPSVNCAPSSNVENTVRSIRIPILVSIIVALTSPALSFSGDIIGVAVEQTAGTADEGNFHGDEDTHGVASAALVTRAPRRETGKRHTAVRLLPTGSCLSSMHQRLALPVNVRGARRESAAGRSSCHPHDIPLYVCSLLI